jgi:spermidine synthase
MKGKDRLISRIDTDFEQYEIVETIYNGRYSRMLYTNSRESAQSGIALDGIGELLFDYNERFMELIRGLKPKSVLLIGGGAFTLPKAINEEFPQIMLDIVEIDPALIGIAIKYFDFKPNPNTKVFFDRGEKYLRKNRDKYDLMVLDVFNNDEVPKSFQEKNVMQNLSQQLRKNGLVAMNIISAFHGIRSATLCRQMAVMKPAFKFIEVFPAGNPESLWLPQNFILTATNQRLDLNEYLRYSGLDMHQNGLGNMWKFFNTIKG